MRPEMLQDLFMTRLRIVLADLELCFVYLLSIFALNSIFSTGLPVA
jgi:hypothetical protein